VLKQTLFDNIAENFFGPLVDGLSTLEPIETILNDYELNVLDIVSFEMSVTNFAFTQSAISSAQPQVQLLDDSYARFTLKDLTLDIEFDYSYVSDPPIFADIGTATLGVEEVTFGFTWTVDGELKLVVEDMELNYGKAQMPADFDGLSDFSIVLSNTINTVVDVFRNRAVSMLNSQLLTPKITAIGNKIISLLPGKIPLGPELYLTGVFAGPPTGD